MEDNPYFALAGMFRKPDAADGLQLCEGVITSVSPLAVAAFNVSFSGADVMINAQMMEGWTQKVSIQQVPMPIVGEETVTEGGLKSGDSVLCLTDGGAKLYVMCKVVGA